MTEQQTRSTPRPTGPEVSDAAHLGAAFAATATRHAETAALHYDQDTVTYAQLATQVRGTAHLMATRLTSTRPHGQHAGGRPAPDDPPVVALLLESSPGFVIAVLAAATIGAAYLPIDVHVPDAYLHAVLADANPTLVVTSTAQAGRLPCTVPMVLVDDLLVPHAADPAPTYQSPGRHDAAYVIYTSGSTGSPKGVVVSHAAMLNSTAARIDAYGVPHRMPLLHSVAFDLSSGVLFWTLLAGGTLILTGTPLRDVAGTLALIREEYVTHLVYPASLYASLLERAAGDPPLGLRAVMIGSERWSPAVIDRHATLLPDTSLFNEYGPTEACVWTSAGHVYDAATGTTAPMSIGRPIRHTSYELRGADGEPVTDDQPGELWIGGANLATGYLHRPDLTAQRFVTGSDGSRVYRTGDLAVVDEHGNYVFVGRIDRQLKVGGNRIEAGHVETVLMTHPDIEQAHVTAGAPDLATVDSAVLTAYLVHRAGAAPAGPAELAAHVAAALPAYMVPTRFVSLAEFPRTLNGKVDETRLPPPTASPPATPQANVPDTGNRIEQTIAAAAATILGLTAVDPDRPLTDLGANSLALVRLAAAVHRDFGVDVPISVLFGQPTVTAVARAVAAAAPSDRPALHAGTHPCGSAPLSGQQHQMWVLQQLAPHALAYHTLFSLQLTGPLDVAVLREALHRIVTRHEMLRTTFQDDDTAAGVRQVIHSPWPVDLDVVDLTGLPYPERVRALGEAIAGQGAVGFDPGRLPLLRWHLYRLGPTQWRLLQVEHHLVHDGWSASLFLAEIRDTYQALLHGGQAPGPLPVQYSDYADWYQRWRGSADHATQLAFWRDTLHGCPSDPVTFHPDRPRPAVHRYTGGCLTATIPAETLTRVDARCAAHRVSRFAALLSAFSLLVWQHTAETDVVIGSAFANRRHHATADLLGMFVNALPLRLHVDPAATLTTLVSDTMRMLLHAQDHQELPLLDLLDGLDVARDPARNPLFQLMFAFHDSPRPDFHIPGPAGDLRGELVIEHNGSAKNDANIVCVPIPARPGSGLRHDGMQVRWEYDSDLFDLSTAQRLLDGFLHLVQEFTDPWTRAVDEVDLLGHAQRDRILEVGTGPSMPVPYPTVHAGVDAAIDLHRDQVAVVHGDTQWTYADLDAHTVAVEHALARADVVVGGVVALTCPPSPALVAARLAVLRRGGVYVCLDPTQPPARLRQLCADAAPCALLGTADTLTVLSDLDVPQINLDALSAPPTSALAPTRPRHDSGRPAHLVYTSGSTGTPKAVITTHANAVTAIHARTVLCGPRPPRALVTLPAIFDVSGSMTFWTLWLGGTVILPAPGDDIRDPATVRALVGRHAVSHVNFVASFYQALLDATARQDADPPPGPAAVRWDRTLRVVAIGGEPCTPQLLHHHTAVLSGVTLLNEYGPTEATVWCTAAAVHTPPPGPDPHGLVERVTVGTPLPNTSVFVVHPGLRLAPLGAVGEVVVGGAGVATGYLHDDALTRDRFVTAAGGPLAGQRLYRTGDRGRLTPDGQVEILGRFDDQVKVRGYRVELGEVERCLRQHPGIADVAVILDRADGDRVAGTLAAYVVPADPHRGTTALLGAARAWVTARLPGYMAPGRMLALAVLPRTSTGKVDRARLAHECQPAATSAGETPRTPTEAKLRDLWRQLLGHSPSSCDDDFFAAGGDSLQAIRLAAAAQGAGLPLTVEQVLVHRTIRAQAALADHTPQAAPVVSRPRRPAGTRLALTPIQAWFFAHDFADPDHFNQARVFGIDPSVPTRAIAAALATTLARHDAFRTRFVPDIGGWHAVLDDYTDTALPEWTLSSPSATATPVADHDPQADADSTGISPWAEQLARRLDTMHRSLRLDGGPLFAFVLAHHPTSAQRWLLGVAHHLLVDAVSWDILRADLDTAVRTVTVGAHPPIPDPAEGLPTFAESAADIDPAAQRWWRNLAAAPKPILTRPTGRSAGPAANVGQLARRTWRLSAHTTRYLTVDGPRLTGSTTRSLLLAALARALEPATEQLTQPMPADAADRVTVGGLYVYVEGHGRGRRAHPEQVIGWCTDLHPVLLDTGNDGPLAALASDIESQLAAAPADDSYGSARYLHPDSPVGTVLTQMRTPEVTFNYLGTTPLADGQLVRAAAMPTGQPIGAGNVLPTPLDITATVTAGTMVVAFAYDPGRFAPRVINAAGDRFTAILEQAARTVALGVGRTRRGARPHFLIHPVGGSVDGYAALARRLGVDHQCYGLPDDSDGGSSIVERAAVYCDRIRAVAPQGPYTITGWSFGAAVAFEMGRLLDPHTDTDAAAQRLILLDPPDPTGLHDNPALVAQHLHAILPDQPASVLHDAAQCTAGLPSASRTQRILALLRVDQLPSSVRGPVTKRIERLIGHHAALAGWAANGTVRGMQIVQSAEHHSTGSDPTRWQLHSRTPLTVAVVPGTHTTMLTHDGLDALAALLHPDPATTARIATDVSTAAQAEA